MKPDKATRSKAMTTLALLALTAATTLWLAASQGARAQPADKDGDCLKIGGCGGIARPGGVEHKPTDEGGARMLRSLRSARPPQSPRPPAVMSPSVPAPKLAPPSPPAPAAGAKSGN